MKLWIDDVRPAPDGYVWYKTVNGAKFAIQLKEQRNDILLSNYPDTADREVRVD